MFANGYSRFTGQCQNIFFPWNRQPPNFVYWLGMQIKVMQLNCTSYCTLSCYKNSSKSGLRIWYYRDLLLSTFPTYYTLKYMSMMLPLVVKFPCLQYKFFVWFCLNLPPNLILDALVKYIVLKKERDTIWMHRKNIWLKYKSNIKNIDRHIFLLLAGTRLCWYW